MGRGRKGRAQRRRPGRARGKVRLLIGVALVAAVVFAAGVLVYVSLSNERGESTTAGSPSGPKAAIVDQLSVTVPNPSFAETARGLLEQAGYTVDYFPSEDVTVDFYRDLPTRGYDLIVLRAHSALTKLGDKETDDVSLYTNEPYDKTKYLSEQQNQRLSIGAYYSGWPGEYFAVTPVFVRSSMKGEFDGATIIMMGCYGLTSDMMAEALVRRGAKAVVSWNGLVSAPYTDQVTESLLRHLVVDGLTIEEATERSVAEVGPDPSYGSKLVVYPFGGSSAGGRRGQAKVRPQHEPRSAGERAGYRLSVGRSADELA